MKNYSFLIIVALAIVTFSCSDEQSVQMNNDDSFAKMARNSSNPILFDYASDDECIDRVKTATEGLTEETHQELKDLTDVDLIVTGLQIGKGQGIITERHYLNTKDQPFVRSEIYNPNTGLFETGNINIPFSGGPVTTFPILDILEGDCPKGYITIGFCEYGDGYGSCVGGQIAGFQSSYSQYGFNMVVTAQSVGGTSICGGFNL